MKYKAVLNSANVLPAPANQVPPKKPSDGTGTADITYDQIRLVVALVRSADAPEAHTLK